MGTVRLGFDQDMQVPIDSVGLTITDDNGGVFTVNNVAAGFITTELLYTGTWAPVDPVEDVDLVNIAYDSIIGNIENLTGSKVATFNIVATYSNLFIPSGSDALITSDGLIFNHSGA